MDEKSKVLSLISLILPFLLVSLLISKPILFSEEEMHKIWPFMFLIFCILLFFLKFVVLEHYGLKQFLIDRYKGDDVSIWTDRLLILCSVFLPLIFTDCFLKNDLIQEHSSCLSWWPFSDLTLTDRLNIDWWVFYIFFIGAALFLSEKYAKAPWSKKAFQWISRYAPIILGFILITILILSFFWLKQIDITTLKEENAFHIITYLFDYNFSAVIPILFIFPSIIIVSKTGKAKYSIDYFFNFYRILLFENPVTISFVIVFLLLPIGIDILYSDHRESVSNGGGIEMWQLKIGTLMVLAPMTTFLPCFAGLIKNYEKSIELYSYIKLRQIISSMTEPVIILGYGYLGKGIFDELKEREIVNDKDVYEVMTPALDKRKVYKNLLIVDKDESVFRDVYTDPLYGKVGMIEQETKLKKMDSSLITVGNISDWAALLQIIQRDTEDLATKLLTSKLRKAHQSKDIKAINVNQLSNEMKEGIVAAFNAIKDNLTFYKDEVAGKGIKLSHEAKNELNNLKGILEKSGKLKKKKGDLLDTHKEDIKWFNIAILKILFPQILLKRQKRAGTKEEPILTAGIIGDISDQSILTKIFSLNEGSEKPLFISTIPDYSVTRNLAKYMPVNFKGIVSCHNLFQFSSLLPKRKEDVKQIIGVYNSYLEGELLGRVLLFATLRWQKEKQSENLPKILIVGGDKRTFYLKETYLNGLRQNGMLLDEEKKVDLEITILSDEDFYKERVYNDGENYSGDANHNDNSLKYGNYSDIIRSPNTYYNDLIVNSRLFIGTPDRTLTIQEFIKKDPPDIIIITHSRADYSIRILEKWVNFIVGSKNHFESPIIIALKGSPTRVRKLLKTYKNRNRKSKIGKTYPTQEFDSMVMVYDDSRELIGSIAESFKREKPKRWNVLEKYKNQLRGFESPIEEYLSPIKLYYCVNDAPCTLVKLCNKLSRLDFYKKDYSYDKILDFQNIRSKNCPGEEGSLSNNRFLIECDVALKDIDNNLLLNDDVEEFACKSLVMPGSCSDVVNDLTKGKKEKEVKVERKCFDKKCINREFCGFPKVHDASTVSPSTSNVGNAHSNINENNPPIAKLFLCADNYNIPGSVTHVLNNLLCMNTLIPENKNGKDGNKIVDIIYLKSYGCFDQRIYKKEFYGNVATLSERFIEKRGSWFSQPFISSISICCITGREEWQKYSDHLIEFLNGHKLKCNDKYSLDKAKCDENNIEIRSKYHDYDNNGNKTCTKTCTKARRLEAMEQNSDYL